jgi:two-component system, NtrC family, sensor kinase
LVPACEDIFGAVEQGRLTRHGGRETQVFYSTRSNLIASFMGVALLVGAVSLLVGGRLLSNAMVHEATTRVKLDLNATREIYRTKIKYTKVALQITPLGFAFLDSLKEQNIPDLVLRLERMATQAELDFAGIVTKDGKTLCRKGPNAVPSGSGTSQIVNPIAALAIEKRIPVSGTVVLSEPFLIEENPELANRARIRLAPDGPQEGRDNETSGVALAAAVPVYLANELIGVIYGGVLLNRETSIIDIIPETVFFRESYKGQSVGKASIFLNDIRIATNITNKEGEKAIGTRAPPIVKERVLERGERWVDRIIVLGHWYFAAYEPIVDIFGDRVGILGVAVLEEKYGDVQKKALGLFILITVTGIGVATGLGIFLAHKIMGPVRQLIKASREVSEGSLTPNIGPISKDEIGVLQVTFKDMVAAMGRRRAASQSKLFQSERQASVGRLAAGVAHEINNPLTGVLTYTHLLLRRKDIAEDVRADLRAIADSTERVRKIVKGLLDFSRQTELDPEPADLNRVVRSSISMMENQALVKGVNIKLNPAENLPLVTLDRTQIQSVLINMILNALDATEPGGNIDITTANAISAGDKGRRGVEIVIADTGCGISQDHLSKLFDPFFTTKEVGQGTGLGLAVSYGIIQRHGGNIMVQSEVGKGTTFTIWLPIDEQAE